MRLTLSRPDDWHVHLRDGDMLASAVAATARCFGRAIVMPNLCPPVTRVTDAAAYRERILAGLSGTCGFEPLMTLYLTDNTSAADISAALDSGIVHGVKWYPAGATTNSAHGVTDIGRAFAALEVMEERGLPLLVHGEVVDPAVDVFDREAVFVERQLQPIVERFPRLKVVLEHVTTREGVEFVRSRETCVGATFTAHHLLLNRNALFENGLRPHHFCLPVLKRERHRQVLVEAATDGDPRFFLGTDSAPHPKGDKESDCGCAGIYTAHAALELYAEVFDEAGRLEKLEAFACHHGADFYGLPRGCGTTTLEKVAWDVPATISLGDARVVPFRAGASVRWRVAKHDD